MYSTFDTHTLPLSEIFYVFIPKPHLLITLGVMRLEFTPNKVIHNQLNYRQ